MIKYIYIFDLYFGRFSIGPHFNLLHYISMHHHFPCKHTDPHLSVNTSCVSEKHFLDMLSFCRLSECAFNAAYAIHKYIFCNNTYVARYTHESCFYFDQLVVVTNSFMNIIIPVRTYIIITRTAYR